MFMHIYVSVCMYVCIHIYVCIYVYIYVERVYVYINIYIYICMYREIMQTSEKVHAKACILSIGGLRHRDANSCKRHSFHSRQQCFLSAHPRYTQNAEYSCSRPYLILQAEQP